MLKIFILSGVPFAVFTGTYYTYRFGLRTGITAGLTGGLALGLFLTAVVGFLHRRCVRKIAGDAAAQHMGVHAIRDIELPMSFEQAFALCIESLECINRCTVIEQDRPQGRITARTGINWKTWGDTISFRLSSLNGRGTRVNISSRPTARTTLVDFGKNLENVNKIVSFLNRQGNKTVGV